jgi:hypothetical protein
MNDIRAVEYKEKIKLVRQQYQPPAQPAVWLHNSVIFFCHFDPLNTIVFDCLLNNSTLYL